MIVKRFFAILTILTLTTGWQAQAQIDVTYCRAHWWLTPDTLQITGVVTTHFKPTSGEISTIDFDLMGHLHVDSVVSHSQKLSFDSAPYSFHALQNGMEYSQKLTFNHSSNKLTVTLPATLAKGVTDSLTVYYHGKLKQTGMGSIGVNRPMRTLWTLSEPYGARDWWPCRQNLCDKIDSMDIFVNCPAELKVASNGVIVSDITNGSRHTTHYRVRHPLSYYTIGVAVGNYKTIESKSVLATGDSVQLVEYFWPSDPLESLDFTDSLINYFSNYFTPYPFANEKYGEAYISGEASIEHQTMTFITDPHNYVTVAHEMMHQWFGNYVTCKSWHSIWVNEGFASFGELLALEHFLPNEVESWHDYNISTALRAKSPLYIADTANHNRIFDIPSTYCKGAMVVVMLRNEIGEPAFRQGCRLILERFGNGFATVDDARQCFEQAADTTLIDFFNRWIYGGGYPNFRVAYNTTKSGKVTIDMKQTATKLKSDDPDFYPLHITVRLVGKNERKDVRLHLTSPQQQFVVPVDFKVDYVIFDPNKDILGIWCWKKNDKHNRCCGPCSERIWGL